MKAFVKKNWLSLITVLASFVVLAVFVLISGGLDQLVKTVTGMNPWWILAAFGCLLIYWILDGYVLHIITSLKYKSHSVFASLHTAMTGLWYSAITPFATGGQPMQVIEMTENGIDPGDASSFITVKSIIYQVCLTLYALLAILFNVKLFTEAIPNFVLFVIVGLVLNLTFIGGIFLICTKPKFTNFLAEKLIRFLGRIRVLKEPEETLIKAQEQVVLFHQSSSMISQRKGVQAFSYLLTGIELTMFYMIPYCIYRAFNLSEATFFIIILTQAVIAMITAFVPLPGGSGAAEGSFYLFFATFFTNITIVPAMFLWRFITYYSCILAGGAINLFKMGWDRIKARRQVGPRIKG